MYIHKLTCRAYVIHFKPFDTWQFMKGITCWIYLYCKKNKSFWHNEVLWNNSENEILYSVLLNVPYRIKCRTVKDLLLVTLSNLMYMFERLLIHNFNKYINLYWGWRVKNNWLFCLYPNNNLSYFSSLLHLEGFYGLYQYFDLCMPVRIV